MNSHIAATCTSQGRPFLHKKVPVKIRYKKHRVTDKDYYDSWQTLRSLDQWSMGERKNNKT